MIDMLTYFGEVTIASANTAAPDTLSPRIVDMIDACRMEDGPHYIRVTARVIEAPSAELTISLIGANELNGEALKTPVVLASRIFSAAEATEIKVGDTLKFGFPMEHTKYLQAKVNAKGTVKLAIAVEFGA